MKKFCLLFLILAIAAFAQGPTNVQRVAQRLDAGLMTATSATSAATLTLTPLAGQYVYLYSMYVTNCAGGTAVTAAATTSITTTNLPGLPSWLMGSGVAAGSCVQRLTMNYPNGFKSSVAGTAVTIVLPTFATNQTIRAFAVYTSAP